MYQCRTFRLSHCQPSQPGADNWSWRRTDLRCQAGKQLPEMQKVMCPQAYSFLPTPKERQGVNNILTSHPFFQKPVNNLGGGRLVSYHPRSGGWQLWNPSKHWPQMLKKAKKNALPSEPDQFCGFFCPGGGGGGGSPGQKPVNHRGKKNGSLTPKGESAKWIVAPKERRSKSLH